MHCLFNGRTARLDLHQTPEAQHLGVTVNADGNVVNELRGLGDADGTTGTSDPVPLGPLGTVPVRALATALGGTTETGSAILALQLTAVAERVTFLLP